MTEMKRLPKPNREECEAKVSAPWADGRKCRHAASFKIGRKLLCHKHAAKVLLAKLPEAKRGR